MKDLNNKIAVITGAGRGIGYELAQGMIEHGIIVYGLDLNFPEAHYKFETIQCDITKPEDIVNLIPSDRVDILINNAGVSYPESFENYDKDLWFKTLEVNLCGPFFLSQKILHLLKKSDSPSIINITSLNAELAFPNNPAYVSSKSALAGLTRSMALDLGKYGIRVNSIAPGYIKTKMTGESYKNLNKRQERSKRTILGRWGTPQDLLGPLLFLSSEISSYITGHALFVDGGWKIKGL